MSLSNYFLSYNQGFVVTSPVQQVFSPLSSLQTLSKTLTEFQSDPVPYIGSILDGSCWDHASSGIANDAWQYSEGSLFVWNLDGQYNVHSLTRSTVTSGSHPDSFTCAAPSDISPRLTRALDTPGNTVYPSPPASYEPGSPSSDRSSWSPSLPPMEMLERQSVGFIKEPSNHQGPICETDDTPPPSFPPHNPSTSTHPPSPLSPLGKRTKPLPRNKVKPVATHPYANHAGPSTSRSPPSQIPSSADDNEPYPPPRGLLRRRAALNAEEKLIIQYDDSEESSDTPSRKVGCKAKRVDDEDYTFSSHAPPSKTRKRSATSQVPREEDSKTDTASRCGLCKMSLGRVTDLARHRTSIGHLAKVRATSGGADAGTAEKFECNKCNGNFSRKDALMRHKKSQKWCKGV